MFDSFAPANSPFGLPVYVARLPPAPFCETPSPVESLTLTPRFSAVNNVAAQQSRLNGFFNHRVQRTWLKPGVNEILVRESNRQIDRPYRYDGDGEISCRKSAGEEDRVSAIRYGRNDFVKIEDAHRRNFCETRRRIFP